MNPFKVFIPTTRGVIRILSITREEPDIRSVLCIEGSFEALPVSGSYDQFVRRPTGVIEKLLGEGSYRTDLDGPVTQGDSWQLGILLAHILDTAGRFLDSSETHPVGETIWASGEVSPSLDIRPVDHIRQKLGESLPQLKELHDGGEAVTVLLHPSNAEEIADLIPESWTVITAERVRDAVASIGVEIAASPAMPHRPAKSPKRHRAGITIGAATVLLVLCLIGYHLPVQALKNAYQYEQAGQHRALLMEIRTNLARRNWVVTNAFYFFEVFYLGVRSRQLASALNVTVSADENARQAEANGIADPDAAAACTEALSAASKIEAVFPMLPATGCALRLSVENGFSHKVRVWLAVTSQTGNDMPVVKFRSGADLHPGDRFQTAPFVVTNESLSLYAVVSDRPDFGWRKWFENMIGTPTGPVLQANIDRLADSGVGVIVARQPGEVDFK